jgi:class 3 adenylate cyclase
MTMPVKRRLAAILAADAVGYSRMMGADEEGTLRVLAAHRAVIDGIIAFHHGRTFGTAGDSVVAEFESAVEAVRCAVEIQDALKTRNDALPEDDRMHFRIGVNLGDVMVSGDNLHGDGVNVAARLESIADPGGVTISSSVYDQITGKLNLSFVDVGSRELKNIAKPIHVYTLSGTSPAKSLAAPARAARRSRAGVWIAAGCVAAVAAGFVAFRAGWLFPGADPRVQAELAKARAEAEAAKERADAAVGAEAKARADAIVANARADAEAIRRKADADAAASRAAAPSKAPSYDGPWTATRACQAFDELPAQTSTWKLSVKDGQFVVERGDPGKAGYNTAKGAPRADGSLVLNGSGIATARRFAGQPYSVFFEGRLEDGRFVMKGRMGQRNCTLVLARG